MRGMRGKKAKDVGEYATEGETGARSMGSMRRMTYLKVQLKGDNKKW